ncbi:hypothetical protein RZS08_61095, partial [Arthrospira platensis SPKY1]|nr:hypothetical protein [Arthrospira platensis SPKY1]
MIHIPMEPQPEMVCTFTLDEARYNWITLTQLSAQSTFQALKHGLQGDAKLSFDNQQRAGADIQARFVHSTDSLWVGFDAFRFRHELDSLAETAPFSLVMSAD